MCLKCERPWGTDADKCYVKSHNVKGMEEFEQSSSPPGVLKTGTAGTLAKMENGLTRQLTLLERCDLPNRVPLVII